MSELSVALVQSFTTWHKPSANIDFIENQLDQISYNVDVIVLPEMWLTGFTMKTHLFGKESQEGIQSMIDWSLKFSALVIGSLLTKVDDTYFNRAYVISEGKIIHTYDKKHLFAFSGEDRYFSPGNNKCIFEYKKWKFCLNICYDLRFPVWSRNLEDFDVLIYCANWPDKRIYAWDSLLKARAIENQCYVLGVNCTGEDAWHNTYEGHSSVVNYNGENIKLLKGKPGILSHSLNQESLNEYRSKFPFLRDRDRFIINQ